MNAHNPLQNEVIYDPTKIHIGPVTFETIAECCHKYGNKITLLSTKDMPYTQELQHALKNHNLHVTLIDDISSLTETEHVAQTVQIIKASQTQCILAMGNETPLNIAKIASLLANNPSNISNHFFEGKVPSVPIHSPIPTIGIPTSYMTLCEGNASFSLRTKDSPYMVRHTQFATYIKECFLNPNFIDHNEYEKLKVIAFSMIPIAVDIYLSPSITPHAALLLKKAIDIVNRILSKLIDEAHDPFLKQNLFYASLYISKAIEYTSSGILIPLGEAIMSLYPDILKDLPIAITGVMTMKYQFGKETHGQDINKPFTQTDKTGHVNPLTSPMKIIENINALGKRLGIPRHLRAFGMKQEDFGATVDFFWKNCEPEASKRGISRETVLFFLRATY